MRYQTIVLGLASLLPLTNSFAADPKLVKAVSDHFEIYTTDNEASVKALLEHFEVVRGYLMKVTGGVDPFQSPVRIFGFKSWGEYSPYIPRTVEGGKAFSVSKGGRTTIVLSGMKKDFYEYGEREYVGEMLNRSAAALPYWMKLGLGELYCTLRPENGVLWLGASPAREFRGSTTPDLNLSVFFALSGGGKNNKQANDFYAQNDNPALGANAGMDTIASGLSVDYQVVAWQLTHMLMFKKEYSQKFGAFVLALSKGSDTAATLDKIYGQSMAGLKEDLMLYWKMPSHAVAKLNFQLDKPVIPEVTQLSPAESAPILAELKAAR